MIKINKAQARKQFEQGKTVYLLPCKVGFSNCWISPYSINKSSMDDQMDFDKLINAYEYYNCISPLGRYSAYYIEA